MVEIVGALLIRGRAVLMGLRSADKAMLPQCWDVIGGHVEAGETPYETLVREVAEEIGVTVLSAEPLDVVTYDLPGQPTLVQHLFVVTGWNGEISLANDEHTELRWFSVDELGTIPDDAFRAYRPQLERTIRSRRPL